MNPTPTGGATAPSPDGHELGVEVGADDPVRSETVADASHAASHDADVLPPLPAPRAARPLPRPTEPPAMSDEDPDGRRFDPVDDDTLTRLLSGLRGI